MKVFEKLSDWQKERASWDQPVTGTVGLVPTMGALHAGHGKLVEESKKACDKTVVSIFVNPTQFNNPRDLDKYPRTMESDVALLEKLGVDAVIYPTPDQIYPDGYKFTVSEREFSRELCGRHRPGHFDGVLTVVLKLFQLAKPTKAFFGEKDYQQFKLIQDMSSAFFLPLEVVPVPTVREADGLAMSSRNLRLSPEERRRAPQIYKTIKEASSAEKAREDLTEFGFVVDYVEDFGDRRFVAAHLGEVRLIDNVRI